MLSVFKPYLTRRPNPVTVIVILYTIAFFFILLNTGVYWDDWTIVSVDHRSLNAEFLDYGVPQQGYLLSLVTAIPAGIWISKVLTFVLFLGATLLLYHLLKSVSLISSEARFFITLITAVFPVNFARISLATFPYGVCFFLFFLAWWTTNRYLNSGKKHLRAIAILLFASSFSLNSLLVFYLIIPLYIMYVRRAKLTSFRAGLRLAINHLDFILIPIVYWIGQRTLFPTRGLYATYNQIQLSYMLYFPRYALTAIQGSLLEPTWQSVGDLSLAAAITAVVAGIGYSFWKSKPSFSPPVRLGYRGVLLLLGCLLFAAGIFSYVVVGHIPPYHEWTDRHELLIPLGASFIIYYVISMLLSVFRRDRWSGPLFMTLCFSFAVLNANTYLDFQRDWLKQQSIAAQLETNATIRQNSTFLVNDTTISLNAIGRTYRFYEYTGLMKRVYHDETRFAENQNAFVAIEGYTQFITAGRYNMQAYQPGAPQYLITILPGDLSLTTTETLRLLGQRIVDPRQFQLDIARIVLLDVKPL